MISFVLDDRLLRYAAFTVDGEGGNPAGVVLDATNLNDADMQQVAADVGYSETAFITARDADRVRIRYFSPLAEVAFCGHATIATSIALADREGAGGYVFETPAGDVAIEVVESDDGELLATLTSVPTRTRPLSGELLDRALEALRWSRTDLDPTYPPHVAFAGMDHLVLAVGDRTTLARLDYDYDALGQLMAEQVWTTAHLVFAESPHLFHARDPFPPGGVVEDPATGAASAAFGGYLRDLGHFSETDTVTVLQGFDNGTPSRLLVQLQPGTKQVRVTGSASPIS